MSTNNSKKVDKQLIKLGFNPTKMYVFYKVSQKVFSFKQSSTPFDLYRVFGPTYVSIINHNKIYAIYTFIITTTAIKKTKKIDKYSVIVYTKNSTYIFTQVRGDNSGSNNRYL